MKSPGTAPLARATDYTVSLADMDTDRQAVLAIWCTHMRQSPDFKFDWFYRRQPFGTPTLLLLKHGPSSEPVGAAGLGTRSLCVQGREVSAGILADLVVLPEHRTLYPALLLQKQMQKVALGLHTVVYGLPNKNSTPIVRRLGYARAGEFVRYSMVLRHRKYLERHMPAWLAAPVGAIADRLMPLYFKPYRVLRQGWQLGWVDTVDARFDALWEQARAFNGMIGRRDAEFLAWRFLSQNGHRFRVFVVSARDGAELAAYAVCEPDGHTLHVRDFLVDPSHEDHLRLLLHSLARDAYAQGYNNLSLEFMGPRRLHAVISAAGMVEREKGMVYASYGSQDEAALRKLDWYMTAADDDRRFLVSESTPGTAG